MPFSLWNSSSSCLPVMESKQQRNTKSISNSPKQSTQKKKKALKNRYESADPLYKNLKIIKFQDLLRLSNCLFMCQLEQYKKLAAYLSVFSANAGKYGPE